VPSSVGIVQQENWAFDDAGGWGGHHSFAVLTDNLAERSDGGIEQIDHAKSMVRPAPSGKTGYAIEWAG
jgi:hypothetical protein